MIQALLKEHKGQIVYEKTVLFSKSSITIACSLEADIMLDITDKTCLIGEIIIKDNKLFFISRSDLLPIVIDNRTINYQEVLELKTGHIIALAHYTIEATTSETESLPEPAAEPLEETKMEAETFEPFFITYLGNEELKRFRLTQDIQEIYLGRDPTNEIIINHPSNSRKHAKIKRDWAGITLYDLASKNGVFINDKKLEKHQILFDGDRIRLGQTQESDPIYVVFKKSDSVIQSKVYAAMSDTTQESSISLKKQEELLTSGAQETIYAAPKKTQKNYLIYALGSLAIIIIAVLLIYFTFIASSHQLPEITTINPSQIESKDEFVVKGINLVKEEKKSIVYVDGNEAPVISSSENEVKAKMPLLPTKSAGIHTVPVQIETDNKISNKHNLQVKFLPRINEMSSSRARTGENLTLYGTHFDESIKNITLWISDIEVSPTKASIDTISFKIPAFKSDKEIVSSIIAEVNGIRSNSQILIIAPPPKDFYELSFKMEKKLETGNEVYTIKTDFAPVFSFIDAGTYITVKDRADYLLATFAEIPILLSKGFKIDISTKESASGAILYYQAIATTLPPQAKNIIEISTVDAEFYSSILQTPLTQLEIADWISSILDDIIGLFAFADYPINTAKISEGGTVLTSVWNQYCSGEERKKIPSDFLEQLSQEQQLALANIIQEFPKEHGKISGKWSAVGDDLFLKASDSYLRIYWDLEESKNMISGSIILGINASIDDTNRFHHNLGTYTIREPFTNRKRKEFRFTLNVPKYGQVVFSAHLIASSLQGSYELQAGDRKGYWKAVYLPK